MWSLLTWFSSQIWRKLLNTLPCGVADAEPIIAIAATTTEVSGRCMIDITILINSKVAFKTEKKRKKNAVHKNFIYIARSALLLSHG